MIFARTRGSQSGIIQSTSRITPRSTRHRSVKG